MWPSLTGPLRWGVTEQEDMMLSSVVRVGSFRGNDRPRSDLHAAALPCDRAGHQAWSLWAAIARIPKSQPVQNQRPKSYDWNSLNFDLNHTHTQRSVIMFEQGSLFWLLESTSKLWNPMGGLLRDLLNNVGSKFTKCSVLTSYCSHWIVNYSPFELSKCI